MSPVLTRRNAEWAYGLFHEFSLRIDEAGVRVYSASIAYHAIVAIISLVSVVLFVAQAAGSPGGTTERMIDLLPSDLQSVAMQQAERLQELSGTSVAIVTIIGLVIGLYGLAAGFAALYDGLNRIHHTHHYLTMVLRYGRGLVVAVGFLSGLLFVGALVTAGTRFGHELFETIHLPVLGNVTALVIRLVAILFVTPIVFTLLLRYGSRARPPWAEAAAAGIASAVVWLVFILGFFAVVQLIHPYGAYGAFGTALTLMLAAYWTCYLTLACVVFARELRVVGGQRLGMFLEHVAERRARKRRERRRSST